jgi:hypothetical protein
MTGMYDEDGELIDAEILVWELKEIETTIGKLEVKDRQEKKRVINSKAFKNIKKGMTQAIDELNKMDVNIRFNMLFTVISALYDRIELPNFCKKYAFNRADRIRDRLLELEDGNKNKCKKDLKYVG